MLVHGRPDERWGEAVIATIVLADGATPDAAALLAYRATALAPHQVPKAIEFARCRERLSGKPLRWLT
jgi:acyl-CoA synthetase (AMP-forming)/AMP-acid ligase II